jgi:predicted enzyme related to lactoylglutathione lyase
MIMAMTTDEPLLRTIDCVRIPVHDLDAGLAFYRDRLRHQLVWRHGRAAGLRLPETDAEIVLYTEDEGMEVDFLVDSADEAARRFEQAGGRITVQPFDIQIGRCAVVVDPFGNALVLLDMSRGPIVTDAAGNVVGPDKTTDSTT